MWALYAALSAVFASLTTIFAKVGLDGVDSYLATAIRTFVVLLMSWGMVFLAGVQQEMAGLTLNNWVFLVLSGIATGLSWLFYFRAIQIGEVSKVVPIDKMSVVLTIVLAILFFKEPFSLKTVGGLVLLTAGTLLLL